MNIFSKYKYFVQNIISFSLLNVLGLFFRRTFQPTKSLLFINNSVLGDTIISSILLENDEIYSKYENVYFLFQEDYIDLFTGYNGKVKLIPYNRRSYKWSLIYRIKLLNQLKGLKLEKCYNLTSSRGISSDELALLSGASKIYCFENTWKKQPKAFSDFIESKYSKIIFKGVVNEYQRHIFILNEIAGYNFKLNFSYSKFLPITNNNKVIKYVNKIKEYVIVAPLASDIQRAWDSNNYYKLIKKLAIIIPIIIIGSKNERDLLLKFSNLDNVSIYPGIWTLNDLAFLIKNCKLYIGNDSGLTHLAIRMNVSMIGIIGGGTYGKYLPFDENEKRKYFYNKKECFGCDWKCIHKERYCITEVNIEDVYNSAILFLINNKKSKYISPDISIK